MTPLFTPPSIYDLPPLETGGTESRRGLSFQDHVAAGFCQELLIDDDLAEVWCESQDDTTLIWKRKGQTQVEYVQSKSHQLDQLWSLAILCDRSQKGVGQSILEKSLAYDRCHEPCSFRIVTLRDVKKDLKVLTYDSSSPVRAPDHEDMKACHKDVGTRVGDFKSKNGRGCDFWLCNALWDVRHSEESVKNANIIKLTGILHSMSMVLFPDQVQELYALIVRKVWDISMLDAQVDPIAKRLTKSAFKAWFMEKVASIRTPSAGADSAVKDKMAKAFLVADVIESALEQRRFYREEAISPKYLPLDDRKLIEQEVAAVLHRLKSRLDSGELPDDGVGFHDLCLAELERLRDTLPINPKPLLSVLQGCMYNIAGRCLHRFRRATA